MNENDYKKINNAATVEARTLSYYKCEKISRAKRSLCQLQVLVFFSSFPSKCPSKIKQVQGTLFPFEKRPLKYLSVKLTFPKFTL